METVRKKYLKQILWIPGSKRLISEITPHNTPSASARLWIYIYKPIKSYYPKAKKSCQKLSPESQENLQYFKCSRFFNCSQFFSRSHARNIKKWSRCSLSLFVHRVINSSKHFYPIIWIKCQPKDQHLSQVLKNILFNQKIFPNYRLIAAWRHKHTKKPPELVSLYLPFPAPYINQEKLCQISSAHIKCRIN